MVRLRLPGGRISAAALRRLTELAASYGNGILQLTSRAGLQLRGLPDPLPAAFVDAVVAAGVLPTDEPRTGPQHRRLAADRALRRTGRPGPLTTALDAGLVAEPALADLPGRFLFVLDDGRGDVVDLTFDLGYQAGPEPTAGTCWWAPPSAGCRFGPTRRCRPCCVWPWRSPRPGRTPGRGTWPSCPPGSTRSDSSRWHPYGVSPRRTAGPDRHRRVGGGAAGPVDPRSGAAGRGAWWPEVRWWSPPGVACCSRTPPIVSTTSLRPVSWSTTTRPGRRSARASEHPSARGPGSTPPRSPRRWLPPADRCRGPTCPVANAAAAPRPGTTVDLVAPSLAEALGAGGAGRA